MWPGNSKKKDLKKKLFHNSLRSDSICDFVTLNVKNFENWSFLFLAGQRISTVTSGTGITEFVWPNFLIQTL